MGAMRQNYGGSKETRVDFSKMQKDCLSGDIKTGEEVAVDCKVPDCSVAADFVSSSLLPCCPVMCLVFLFCVISNYWQPLLVQNGGNGLGTSAESHLAHR